MEPKIAQSYWEEKILKWEKSRYSDISKWSPFSWSVRARLHQAEAILKQRVQPGMSLLELGCGSGVLAEALRSLEVSYLGLDIASNAIIEAKCKLKDLPRFEFEQADILDYELPETDIALFLGVTDWLEHEELSMLFQKIKSPHMLFSFTSSQEVTPWNPYRYYRWLTDNTKGEAVYCARVYSLGEIQRLLADAGFSMELLTRPSWSNPGALVWAKR